MRRRWSFHIRAKMKERRGQGINTTKHVWVTKARQGEGSLKDADGSHHPRRMYTSPIPGASRVLKKEVNFPSYMARVCS